jgi:transcriptional regulator with GAF, ATPase, and Fis domain
MAKSWISDQPVTELDSQEEAKLLGYDGGVLAAQTPGIGVYCAIADLVRSVCDESRPHPEEVLERFALLASTHIQEVADASVVLVAGKRGIRPSAASGGFPHLIDEIQAQALEGPAFDAIEQRQTIRVDDLAADTRWPRFTQRVLSQTPVRSMLCYRIHTELHDYGVLSLHAHKPHGFDADAAELGRLLATHAAVTLHNVHRGRQFRSALGSRDIIGQAKGMLMERYDVGAGAAFSLLTKLSQESGKPVVVVAKEVVEASTSARS